MVKHWGLRPETSIGSMIKLKSILNERSISDLSGDEKPMVMGIIQILNRVKDLQNRKEIADEQIRKFKDEGIVFDYNEFMERLGIE
jgi:DNA polymerase IIIc chi subunit